MICENCGQKYHLFAKHRCLTLARIEQDSGDRLRKLINENKKSKLLRRQRFYAKK